MYAPAGSAARVMTAVLAVALAVVLAVALTAVVLYWNDVPAFEVHCFTLDVVASAVHVVVVLEPILDSGDAVKDVITATAMHRCFVITGVYYHVAGFLAFAYASVFFLPPQRSPSKRPSSLRV